MGTSASRMAISQTDFADRIRLTTIKPAAGRQVEAIQVYPQSSTSASFQVRFSLENHRHRSIKTFTFTLSTILEEGTWRFHLQGFLNLLTYW